MSEGSLPPFGVSGSGSAPRLFGRLLGRFLGKLRRAKAAAPDREPDPALRSRAAAIVGGYVKANAALFERAERLTEKSARLERAGTPSDSAGNRAARAREEVEAGLAALRASFARSEDDGLAFDREVALLYPELGLKTSGTDAPDH